VIRAALLLAAVAANTGGELRFVACPIYRDTDDGRKSGCWLADDPATGTRYDVTAAPTKPDWNHAVLVEGLPNAGAGDPCGGVMLEPARVSVLEAPCTRHMIAAEGYKGRRFALPERNVRPLYEERQRPTRPYTEGRFTIPFDFGSHFVIYQLSDYYLDATINYALDVQPARIVISGHAQTEPAVISGESLSEPKALARERAELVKRALVMRGIAADTITVKTEEGGLPYMPAAFDDLVAPRERRVDVSIVPLSAAK
jgi:outer membrane protein OmpA-like peptidoglycan-associated protein